MSRSFLSLFLLCSLVHVHALSIPKPRMQRQAQQLSWDLPRQEGGSGLSCTKCRLLERTATTASSDGKSCRRTCAGWEAWVSESVCSLVCSRIEGGERDVCIRFKLCPRDGQVRLNIALA